MTQPGTSQPASLPIRAQRPAAQEIALPPLGERSQKRTLKPTVGRSTSHWIALALCSLVIIFLFVGALAFGALQYRLSSGPMRFTELTTQIEEAINADLPGVAFALEDVVLRQAAGGVGFQLRFLNVSLRDVATGDIVLRAPQAAISVSVLALLAGRLAADEIEVFGARFRVEANQLAGQSGSDRQLGDAITGAVQRASARVLQVDTVQASQRSPSSPLLASKAAFVQSVAEGLARARRGTVASGYLRRFSLSEALVLVQHSPEHSVALNVRTFSFDLSHREKRSRLVGAGIVETSEGTMPVGLEFEE
ncbi:MAG: hypothetical protein AAFO79_02260, partial [Pseudomonadota bacterium]